MKNFTKYVLTATFAAAAALTAATAQAGRDEVQSGARDEAINTTEYLVETLVDIQDMAEYLASRAARRGNHHDAHHLANVADSAAALEQKVEAQILYPLHDGATFAYAKAQLARLSGAFGLLQSDAGEVYYLDDGLADLIASVGYLKYELNDILASGDRSRPGRSGR